MEPTDSDETRRVEAVRQFNRFYTRYSEALDARLPRSEFSLTEIRVLYELARSQTQNAAALARELSLDTGYLSRILTGFEKNGLIARTPSTTDARQSLLALTEAGRARFAPFDSAMIGAIRALLDALTPAEQEQMIAAMRVIERLLGKRHPKGAAALRAPRAGEYGWLVHRQAQWFAHEMGWDRHFEASLAQSVAALADTADPARETGWIAEQDGTAVGSAFVTAVGESIARVRLLFVEPHARRLGIGSQLLDECVRFARQAGYKAVELTLAATLTDAKRIAGQHGFRYRQAENARHFGRDLIVEHWVRELSPEPSL
ncbi:MAG TPA: bifunctional helix-turn-helix transcriptional regulator/GNAT family N-acetyltransferase [Paraburkholderia sp.]|jgi:DNA-binding MarR family transcriptional regulator/predicted N-acetyltransferase YhbS|nr:bifunctional helix-turn-helix transcriptional regulator/GNAT family N-acetyltransferase [Paraburkholderia sp.]